MRVLGLFWVFCVTLPSTIIGLVHYGSDMRFGILIGVNLVATFWVLNVVQKRRQARMWALLNAELPVDPEQ